MGCHGIINGKGIMGNYYDLFKALHIFSVMSWMVGMLYLPRLYVYHCEVAHGSEADALFQKMERKLLRIIMNPSMVATYIFGVINAYIYGFVALGVWFHIKISLVAVLTVLHGLFAKWRRGFVNNTNKHSARFDRIVHEVPAVLALLIIIMVVVKPLD
jgi:putative membrane protein